MTAEALILPIEVADLIRDGALIVSNLSGKDGQCMLIELLKIVPANQLLVVHASLGEVEWEGALEHAQQQAQAAGLPFIVAHAVKTFLEMVEHRYKVRPGPNSPCWPSAANRQCTSDLKRGPIEREVRRYAKEKGYTKIVSCMGIRAQESSSRSKRPALSQNKRGTIPGRAWFEWLPIHHFSEQQVFETIRAAGQKPHWAYEAGNRRLSCCFCIMGHPRDIANAARHRPELLAKLVEIEERTGYVLHQSRRSLTELVAVGNKV